MTFIIHGATGAQGGPVARKLKSEGRSVSAAVRGGQEVPDGIKPLAVDLADAAALSAAYSGAEGVFVHLPMGDPGSLQRYADSVAQAVGESKPRKVVISTSGQIVDEPNSPLQAAPDSPIMRLIEGVSASGVPTAVVAPRLFLENLLLPVVEGYVRSSGILRYPLASTMPVSWASHLDVADVAAKLLTGSEVVGVVAVGQLPALTGDDLAAAFSRHLSRQVSFEALAPEQFGELIEPLFGKAGAAPVVGLYSALGAAPDNAIGEERSGQRLLGVQPRSVDQWLAEVNF